MKPSITRRGVLLGAAGAATLAYPRLSRAATDFPSRPVTLMHGFAAGSNLDIGGRIFADGLQKRLGQPVTIDPQPGASGVTASAKLANSKPDGYHLILLTAGHSVATAVRKSVPYDTIKDFTFVSMIYDRIPFALLTSPNHKVKTIADLVAMSKSAAQPMTFATSGVGQTTHLAMELLISMTGAKLRHIPYKEIAQATIDLGAERIDFVISGLTVANSQIKSGAVRALGITSAERSDVNPDLPTIAEGGVPGFEVVTYTGLAAPAGLPDDITSTLASQIAEAVKEPDYDRHVRSSGGVPMSSTPEILRDRFAADVNRWNKIVEEAKIAKT